MRLVCPARHVIINSSIYKDKEASYGTIWRYRPWWVLQPTINDGLCHWCVGRKNHIIWFHKAVPHTDPNGDTGKKPENLEHNLHLWTANTYKNVDDYLFLILSTYREMDIVEKARFKEEMNQRLVCLKELEHHFRLAAVISKREKELAKDFPTDLLRIWTDFMTPMLVGKGGLRGEVTAEQPHNLALVTVHGLMLQYRDLEDPDIVKKPRNAFSMNLSMHSTKRSFFTMQHILHALEQEEVNHIFRNPRFKRVEFTFDCGSTY